jgi:glycosyltransferase involved in cell wall biosynthesis
MHAAERRRPIRLAYLAHGIEGAGSGVRAKILSQIATWARLRPDIEFGLFVRCEAGSEADWRGQPNVVSVRSSRRGIVGRLVQRELLSLDLARWRPNVVYFRQSTVSPSIVVLARAMPTVVELNTLDLAEYRLRSKLRYVFAILTRRLLLSQATGIVAVADEVAQHSSVARFRKPMATIPNSIRLEDVDLLPPTNNDQPRLVFIGAPDLAWNGIDKIERLATLFPTWRFDLVGPSGRELAARLPNVHAHGRLEPAEYRSLLAHADVGLGPLALHRKDMSEASPLKVGEYLASGLPVILGHPDTRFPRGADFLLEIPNDEANVESSLERIAAFVDSWRGRRVDRAQIGHIDAGLIEERRLRFILEVAGFG